MARPKNLDTLVKTERKRICMVPGRLSLRPRTSVTVPINSGGFAQMEDRGLDIETENINHHARGGMYTRLYDPALPKDKEVLDAVEELLLERPHWADDVRYQIRIVGEFEALQPWNGYDEQDAVQLETLWNAMPDSSRPQLESVMKYELSKEEPNDEKIKVLNKLYRAEDKELKEQADMGAQL